MLTPHLPSAAFVPEQLLFERCVGLRERIPMFFLGKHGVIILSARLVGNYQTRMVTASP
jgi:hypothetical protein